MRIIVINYIIIALCLYAAYLPIYTHIFIRPENVVCANTEHGPFNNYYIVIRVPFYLFFRAYTYKVYTYIYYLQPTGSRFEISVASTTISQLHILLLFLSFFFILFIRLQ